MKKIVLILRESFQLVLRHKFYFLLPMFILLAALAVLIYELGPAIVVSFIYAGL